MKRFFILALCAVLSVSPVLAGSMTLVGVGKQGTVIAGYTGPGDVVSGATAWWGLRCYNTAYAGNVVDVWDAATGSTTNTLITCSSGGILNTGSPTALATTCASGCVVKTLYDQSGALACSGSTACDLGQNTNASRLSYVQSCIGSLPCMQSATYAAKGVLKVSGAGFATIAQPYTFSAVAIRTGSFTSQGDVMTNGGSVQFGFWTTASQFLIYANGSVVSPAASDSNWHAFQGVFNGASSSLMVDATANTGLNIGTAGISATFEVGGVNHGLQGSITEAGIWPSALNGTQQTNLCHNQFVYWGTSTSC